MAELKTKLTSLSVSKFLDAIPDQGVRDDCYEIARLMEKITHFPPRMWGTAIVGFGTYHYKYESGHEGDMCVIGFSPRKANITLYVKPEPKLLKNLGKYKAGKGCLYFKRLMDVDTSVLERLITNTVEKMRNEYGG